jgi:hypothetical protein
MRLPDDNLSWYSRERLYLCADADVEKGDVRTFEASARAAFLLLPALLTRGIPYTKQG